jgi:hypothetical protein
MSNVEWCRAGGLTSTFEIRPSKFGIPVGVVTPLPFFIRSFIFGPMRNSVVCPSLTASKVDEDPAFNVVIAYEDFDTGKHARRTYDFLVQHLGDESRFRNQMWKFDVLGVPKLKQMAAKDAAAADIIIISAHGLNELPSEVKAWIELWTKEKIHAMALVGLFDPGECASNPVRSYLEDVAAHAGLEFFAQPGLWPGREEDGIQPRISAAGGKALTVLADLVQHDKEIPRWGINE